LLLARNTNDQTNTDKRGVEFHFVLPYLDASRKTAQSGGRPQSTDGLKIVPHWQGQQTAIQVTKTR